MDAWIVVKSDADSIVITVAVDEERDEVEGCPFTFDESLVVVVTLDDAGDDEDEAEQEIVLIDSESKTVIFVRIIVPYEILSIHDSIG